MRLQGAHLFSRLGAQKPQGPGSTESRAACTSPPNSPSSVQGTGA